MIRIITDSTCDISKEEQMELNIKVIPLTVYFGDTGYQDGIELSKSEFYEKLEKSDVLPKTSQLNPSQFEEAFKEAIDAGDEVVCIVISQELSGTYQSAVIAADEFEGSTIEIVDSTTASIGLALLVKEAVKLRDQGLSAKLIAVKIRLLAIKVRLYGIIDTLKYLKMGGRLSAASAVIGNILGIHPIIEVRNGKVEAVGKVRSLKSGLEKLIEYTELHPIDYRYGFGYGHSNCEDKLEKVKILMKEHIKTDDISQVNMGSVVGTHTGPGVICIAYIED